MWQDFATWLGVVENLILAFTLIMTVALSWMVFRQTQRHFQLQRTQEFIGRFNGQAINEHRRQIDLWVATGEAVHELLDRAKQEDADATQVRQAEAMRSVANFFQELGAAAKHGTLNDAYCWDVFGGLITNYWQLLSPYVFEMRYRRGRPTLWNDFEALANQMQQQDAKRGVADPRKPKDLVYIFGYGSLVGSESIRKTAGPLVDQGAVQTAWLNGFCRGYTVFGPVEMVESGDAQAAVFLDVQPHAGSRCNGVLVPVPASLLQKFDERERMYNRVDVTRQVEPRPDRTVFVYSGKPPFTSLPDDAAVMAEYEANVLRGLRDRGAQFTRDFDASTRDDALPRVSGSYRFADATQNAAAGRA